MNDEMNWEDRQAYIEECLASGECTTVEGLTGFDDFLREHPTFFVMEGVPRRIDQHTFQVTGRRVITEQ